MIVLFPAPAQRKRYDTIFFGPANYYVLAEHEDITCLGNGSPSEDALSGLVRGNKDGFGVCKSKWTMWR